MKMLRLLLSAVLLCAIFGNVVAQNRGTSRYVPTGSEEIEVERQQRPASRRTSVRRPRPTPATESSIVYEEPQTFQPPQPQSDTVTTARRVPSRNAQDQYPPPPAGVPLVEEHLPVLPLIPDEPHVPVSAPDNKQQGRRRRQKKRRRPQKSEASPEKIDLGSPDGKNKDLIVDVLDENEKRSPHHSSTLSRNRPVIVDNNANFGSDEVSWSNNPAGPDAGAEPYFPPQTGTNRLPLGDSEPIDDSRRYPQSSPVEPVRDAPSRYSPSKTEVSHSQRGSYVPVLPPVRSSSQQHSRSPYPEEKRTEQSKPATRHNTPRTSNNRSPSPIVPNPDAFIRNTVTKPSDNSILVGNEPGVPLLSHGEVRLPPTEQPLLAPEFKKGSEGPIPYSADQIVDHYQPDDKSVELGDASNRPLDPLNVNYETPYPSSFRVNDKESSESVSPNRRQESASLTSRNAVSPYSQDKEIPKSRHADTDARKQISVYEPPLQRSGSRYQPDRSGSQPRSASHNPSSDTSEQLPNRSRGASRYQPENIVPQPTRKRGHSEEADSDYPSIRGSPQSYSEISRTRGASRSQPGSTEYKRPQEAEADYPSIRGSSQSYSELSRTRGPSRSQPESTEYVRPEKSEPDYPSIRGPPQSYSELPKTRSSSRSQSERSEYEQSSRSNSPQSQVESIQRESPRSRGSSRYQPETISSEQESSHRESTYGPSHAEEVPSRTRTSSRSTSSSQTVNQNARRHQPEEEKNSRTPINPEAHIDAEYSSGDRVYRQRVPSSESSEVDIPYEHVTRTSYRNPIDISEEHNPTRSNPRSHSQFETREPEKPYEESTEDQNSYVPEYQEPRQTDRRRYPSREQPDYQNSRQRAPAPAREEIEYQPPPQRQSPPQRQPQPQYQAPPQRQQQPQYQAPQNPRRQPSPEQPKRRNQEPGPSASHERSGGSRFKCPEPYGFFADPTQCDKYYECRNGTAVESLCQDGLAFNEVSAPKYLRCDSLRDVDCSSRTELQEPRPTKNCPRKFGLFPHETDCTKFWNCVDGTATEVQCPPGLTYNDDRATCDWADLVKTSCKTEDLLGFTCPEPTAFDLQDGVFSRYPHPDNCQLHFICIKGEDGLRRPRMLSCNEGLVFDSQSSSCTRPDEVPGCEEFYGPPAPKRKPSRDPLPREPEELVDEEPKPRRRNQNRRTRN